MKKFFKLLLLTFTVFSISFAKDNSLQNIQDKGEIIIGLDDTFAPMGFRDEEGKIIGFDIDLANEVANRIGVKATFKPCEWDGIIFDLRSKRIDLIWNGLTITPEREKQIAFSTPYFDDDQIVIVKNPNIKSFQDLKDKKIGVQLGSASYFAFENSVLSKETNNLNKYSTNVEALLDLEAGRTDAVVIDAVVGKYYISKKPDFIVLNDILEKQQMGVGMRKDDVALKNKIDETLANMKADGSFDKIYKKWFGDN
ncbi:amino acid ABC transporter substrate-binding protein [Candidatus Cetobacterium colombiensis]|uniref:Amino acid ABC transporter substrate-binding protein n=1 Tax=Candidatus Cetobacterium colombiensis TaxID=3073100 RepID=A0ABU4WAP2_9FUSO|nr:amino acid ABC transporter substrate-binding protein [Candidatus Cetobacterium colombiensis]MDX8336618.1 amino acid ABC transporter substrate-binding protein [Candidatus Cetobacterium colombiensis]